MKKTFQKTLIAAAAGVAMMSAVGTASANSLLFPYWTTTTGAQSVLSISGNAAIVGASGKETLHYVYNYGPTCIHADGNGSITANDLMQHSIANPLLGAGGFGKAVPTDASTPYYFNTPNSYGFLVVSTKTTNVANLITGEMAIVDPSTGLVTSYAGISNGLDTTVAGNEGNFTSITDQKFNLSFYGSGVTTTSWFGVVVGDMSAKITGGLNWDGSQTISNQGFAYNNDEAALSGIATKRITCAGTILPSDLTNSNNLAALNANGGLVHALATTNLTDVNGANISNSTGLVLSKMQTVQAAVGAPFAGKQFLHREAAPAF